MLHLQCTGQVLSVFAYLHRVSGLNVSHAGHYNARLFRNAFIKLCVYLNGVQLVNSWSEVVGVSPECDLQLCQELVHAGQQSLWPVKHSYAIFRTVHKYTKPLVV